MTLVLILLLVALPACTTQKITQETKGAIQQGQKDVQQEPKSIENRPTKQESNKSINKEEERVPPEQIDNASIINIPRSFQRREEARVTHISEVLINMSYRENNRQVQFKIVNFEQDDGVRKRTVKYCFDKDSIFFKKRDILTYHISTAVCNTHGKPYIALPIKIERER